MTPARPSSDASRPAALTTAQAARYLNMSTRSVQRLIAAQEIRVSRVGTGAGSIRITVAALDEYLARTETPAHIDGEER